MRPGATGTVLTTADLLINQANLVDANDYLTFLPETRRHQVYAAAEQELSDRIKLTVMGFYNRRDSVLDGYPQSGVRTLPATSPYYIAGIPGVAPGAPLTVAFDLYKDVGIGRSEPYDVQFQGAANLTIDLFSDWRADLGVNISRNRNCANCIPELSNNVDPIALQAALNNGSYNPFSSTPASEAVLRQILPRGFDINRSYLNQYSARMDGPLFSLPGGEVKAAFGGEYFEISQYRTSIGIKATSDVPFALANRNIKAGYAEIFVPIIGEASNLSFMQSLVFNAAVRHESYSDVGTTTNPKFGATWTIVDGLEVRGAWRTSFRAPNLIESNPEFFSRVSIVSLTNLSRDPAIGLTNPATNQTNVLNVAGSSRALVPETKCSGTRRRSWLAVQQSMAATLSTTLSVCVAGRALLGPMGR